MLPSPTFPLQIFYDGNCSICAAEIKHYLHQDHGGRLLGVNIHGADFVAPAGLTPAALMYEMHVIDARGTIYRNIAAFQVIWQAFPAIPLYCFLAAVFALPLLNPLARGGYRLFARLRRYLPQRRACASGVCSPGARPPE
jgi:predicted DCC family thiol-disulfide oxidoreductase YuxK